MQLSSASVFYEITIKMLCGPLACIYMWKQMQWTIHHQQFALFSDVLWNEISLCRRKSVLTSFNLLLTHHLICPKPNDFLKKTAGWWGNPVSIMSQFGFVKKTVVPSARTWLVSNPGPAGYDSGQVACCSLCCTPNLRWLLHSVTSGI